MICGARRERRPPPNNQAILSWLGEFDVMEDFAERALEYRMRIGVAEFPEHGEAYLRALIRLAKETGGA